MRSRLAEKCWEFVGLLVHELMYGFPHPHTHFGFAPAPPPVRLTYFGTLGLAQPIRLALSEAGVPFTEHTPKTREEWLNIKKTIPTGNLPILEIDGQRLFQSRAILGYLGRKFGMYGGCAQETYQIDTVLETMTDVWKDVPFKVVFPAMVAGQMDHPDVVAAITNWQQSVSGKFEALNKCLRPGIPFFVGMTPTIADFFVYGLFQTILSLTGGPPEAMLEGCPNLLFMWKHFASRPRIAAFEASPAMPPRAMTLELAQSVMRVAFGAEPPAPEAEPTD